MTTGDEKNDGRVCLVGAGPGDVGLITARGLDRLRAADVVVVDALVNRQLLEHAPPHAVIIDAGKRGGRHKLEQHQINELLLEHARQGRFIVRLKGGDPFVFGRGAEEVAFLASHGVEVEVVPGVTAGTAAPLCAGIAVTHRQLASSVTLVTGHEDPAKDGSAVDYRALASLTRTGGTLCFYMAIARLDAIARRLIAAGLNDQTPAAVVQWGATAAQRSVRGTLADIAGRAADAALGAPAIIIIGAVAALAEPGLDFFTQRPLFGRRIVITRTRHQASSFRDMLADLGADVLVAPTIELVPPSAEEWGAIDDAIHKLDLFDWLVLTSTNGVDALADRMDRLGLDARSLAGVKVAAIGDATAGAVRSRLGVRADLVPEDYVAEALAEALIEREGAAGRRFLLLRADIARKALPQQLAAAGAQVTELAIYQTKPAAALPADVLHALRSGEVDWITFTSSSTARHFAALLGEERGLIDNVRLASIGPITSATMRELGMEPTVEATVSNLAGLTEAMVEHARAKTASRTKDEWPRAEG